MDLEIAVFGLLGLGLLVIVVAVTRHLHRANQKLGQHLDDYLGFVPDAYQIVDKTHRDTTYRVRLFPVQGLQAARLEFGIVSRNRGQLSVRLARKSDARWKHIGLVNEVSTGEADFDQRFFVDSAEPEFAGRYLGDPRRRKLIAEILASGYASFALEADRIVATALSIGPGRPDGNKLPSETLAHYLTELATNQPAIAAHLGRDRRHAWHVKITTGYSVGFLIGLAGAGMLWLALRNYLPLDLGSVFLRSLIVAVPATLLCSGLAILLVRGQSSAARHLAMLTTLGAISLTLCAFAGTMLVNATQDTSVLLTREPEVIRTHRLTARGGTRYQVVLRSWRSGREQERLAISKAQFVALSDDAAYVRITTGRGRFGFEWLQTMAVLHSKQAERAAAGQ